MRTIPFIAILFGAAALAAAQGGGTPSMPTPELKLKNASDARSAALSVTGFDRLGPITTAAKLEVVNDDATPFLANEIKRRPIWRVEMKGISLKLPSAIPGFEDRYKRDFTVLLNPETGQLLAMQSRCSQPDPEMRPEPSAASAEKQLKDAGETYHGLPRNPPRLSLLDALDAVLDRGIGSPLLAKEIYGVLVLHSKTDSPAKPVWAITLRGIPPLNPHGQSAEAVPIWQRNHIRNVVDAETGQVLFATTIPQPDAK
jgi:hypothetical protein